MRNSYNCTRQIFLQAYITQIHSWRLIDSSFRHIPYSSRHLLDAFVCLKEPRLGLKLCKTIYLVKMKTINYIPLAFFTPVETEATSGGVQ